MVFATCNFTANNMINSNSSCLSLTCNCMHKTIRLHEEQRPVQLSVLKIMGQQIEHQ